MANENGRGNVLHTGWDWTRPFGSIPGGMPDARESFSIGANGATPAPPTPVAHTSVTGAIPADENGVHATPPPTTAAGPSPSGAGYAPAGVEIPSGGAGYPSVGEAGAPAPADAHPEVPGVPAGAPSEGMPDMFPGWAESGGMVGPEIGAGAPAPAPKKRSGWKVAAGIAGIGLGVGGLILAIARGRRK